MHRLRILVALAALVAGVPLGASAADDTIRVAVNKAELLRFDKAPTSVLVVNPAIADVVADGSPHVFVLGKTPGETQLFVLGEGGKTMLEKTVRVVSAPAGEVTVYRAGESAATLDCSPRCTAPAGAGRSAAPAAAAAH